MQTAALYARIYKQMQTTCWCSCCLSWRKEQPLLENTFKDTSYFRNTPSSQQFMAIKTTEDPVDIQLYHTTTSYY